MGLDFRQNTLDITDAQGNNKFSLEKRMPHILYNIPGVVGVPLCLQYEPRAGFVERTEEFILVNNSIINNEDYFLMPFFKINGGIADTGDKIISAAGSTLLRNIIQPSTNEFLGSTTITPIVEPGYLKLVVKHSFNRQGYTNITGDDIVNIAYRIYYGRFK